MKNSVTSFSLLLGFGLGSNLLFAQVTPPPVKAEDAVTTAARGVARCKASELIGCAITNVKNESLGEIQDIVLDHGNQRIAYAVVCYGGVLGMGDKCFAMPWRVIEISQRSAEDTPRATLGLDPAALKAAPGFDKSAWPDMANAAWATRVDEYYAARKDNRADESTEQPKGGKVDGVRPAAAVVGTKPFAHRRVSKLIGMDVTDDKRSKIATVEDVFLETKAAVIDGFLLSFGGTLGIGERMALVPTETLILNQEKGEFRFAGSKATLESLALEDGKLPALNSDNWLGHARALCAKAPVEASVSNGNAAVLDAAVSPALVFADVYDLDTVKTVHGTIATIGSVRVGDRAEERVRIRMRTKEGEQVVVYAAPASFEAQSALGLRAGQMLEVTGATARHGHQSVLLAGSMTCAGKTATLRDAKGKVGWDRK